MFFDLGSAKKDCIVRVPPPIPDTGWRAPKEFPNLSGASCIGFDVERKELDWAHGPGWAKGSAHTVGIALAALAPDGSQGSWYFPIAHEVEPQDNLDRNQVISYVKSVLETDIPKFGANLYYDIGSLTDDGITVQGDLYDCQFAEALLDNDGLVNLDYLGVKYLGLGKETNKLYDWIKRAYGIKSDPRINIWRAPPRLVGPYAEVDALRPIQILQKQWGLLQHAELLPLFRIECGLIPLTVDMRLAGIQVDLQATEDLQKEVLKDVANLYDKLYAETGIAVSGINSSNEVAKIFDKVGIEYQRTEAGNPSFRKDFLESLDHPIAKLIVEIRGLEKINSTFLQGYILNGHINGKLYGLFNQLRSDDSGTITGRFSSDNPNLQNIPVRKEIGKRVRQLFIPDPGHTIFRKTDYSQIEYRYLAHFAVGPGADEMRGAYWENPKTDYHDSTFRRLGPLMNWDMDNESEAKRLRRPVKNINFGLIYGMTQKKLIRSVAEYFGGHLSTQEGNKLFDGYHKANPYVKPTMEFITREVYMNGYITTVLGRRTRINLWEPIDRIPGPRPIALPYDKALKVYGPRIRRAGAYKGLNYKLQGSAADQIKKGMYDCYHAGVFDRTGIPRLQAHDELDFSVAEMNKETNEAFTEMKHIMETCINARVPIVLDVSDGKNWGDAD